MRHVGGADVDVRVEEAFLDLVLDEGEGALEDVVDGVSAVHVGHQRPDPIRTRSGSVSITL